MSPIRWDSPPPFSVDRAFSRRSTRRLLGMFKITIHTASGKAWVHVESERTVAAALGRLLSNPAVYVLTLERTQGGVDAYDELVQAVNQ